MYVSQLSKEQTSGIFVFMGWSNQGKRIHIHINALTHVFLVSFVKECYENSKQPQMFLSFFGFSKLHNNYPNVMQIVYHIDLKAFAPHMTPIKKESTLVRNVGL